MKTLISVIVPLYNEEEVIGESYRRLTQVMSSMEEDYELIFVNDGSRDKTFDLARGIQEKDPHVVLVDFSRNFGHQMAVSAGLEQARGDAVVIIDADLQDPPELIPKMVEMWRGGAEVVYGKRASRQGETAFKKLTAFCYYRVLDALSGWKIPKDTGDFRLMDRKVADVLRSMPEHNRFLRGMVSWLGFRQVPLEFVREERFAGTTKYPLKKMLKLASDGIVSFSGKPFGIMRVLGGLLLAAGLADLLRANGFAMAGKKILVLGSGGTSKTACAVAYGRSNAGTVLWAWDGGLRLSLLYAGFSASVLFLLLPDRLLRKAAARLSQHAMLPSDMVEELCALFSELEQ